MTTADKSFSDLLQNIIADIQELIRSELRLAKAEFREGAEGFKYSATLLGAGALSAFFAVFFALYSAVFALARLMPDWAAALSISLVLAAAGGLTIRMGVRRAKQVHFTPERTIQSVRELT
jgi:hypothetical protein